MVTKEIHAAWLIMFEYLLKLNKGDNKSDIYVGCTSKTAVVRISNNEIYVASLDIVPA